MANNLFRYFLSPSVFVINPTTQVRKASVSFPQGIFFVRIGTACLGEFIARNQCHQNSKKKVIDHATSVPGNVKD